MAVTGQLGFKSETTWGTAVTVDKFHPGWLNGNPSVDQAPLISQGMRSGRRTPHCVRPGFRKVSGSFTTELFPVPMATLLRHMFGTINTTGAGPYVHTASLGNLTGQSMTMQFSVPESATGTDKPFTLAGCKIPSWTLKCSAGEIAQLELEVIAKDYVTATALASASYASVCPFTFVDGSLSVAGSTVAEVKSAEFSKSSPLRDTPFLGSTTVAEQIETGMSDLQIKADVDFRNLTLHDLANTSVASVLTFNNGTDSLVITSNVFVLPATPTHPGGSGLPSFNFTGIVNGTTDPLATTAVLTNTESSAA